MFGFRFNYSWITLLWAWIWDLEVICNQSWLWQRLNDVLHLFTISYHLFMVLIIWNGELKKKKKLQNFFSCLGMERIVKNFRYVHAHISHSGCWILKYKVKQIKENFHSNYMLWEVHYIHSRSGHHSEQLSKDIWFKNKLQYFSKDAVELNWIKMRQNDQGNERFVTTTLNRFVLLQVRISKFFWFSKI